MSSAPCFTPRAMTPSARNGSNIRGKMVTKSILIDPLRKVDDDSLSLEIDLLADRRGERDFIFAPVGALHVQEHPTSALVGLDDFPAFVACRVDPANTSPLME